MMMKPSRREFLGAAAAAATAPLVPIDPMERLLPSVGAQSRKTFLHGVASGDPLADRVIIWTRVSGATPGARPSVRWEIAHDQSFRRVAGRGETRADAAHDFTVKIDVPGLQPGTAYYYRFEASGEQSPVGRTRTLPDNNVRRVRLALASCSNLPFGYFNVYRNIARRADLDAVLHLGDYIYEYANRDYGDGSRFGRVPQPDREIVSLEDYRTRHAQYKTDPDLQEAHRQHPWIVVWDDHEITNNTWRDGAQNHQPAQGEGPWTTRRNAAVRAYYEWMPIRQDASTRQVRIYRSFAFGALADVVMLDTRVTDRDQEAPKRGQIDIIEDPKRSLLGRTQEDWLLAELLQSKAAGVRWQLLGQQVMFAPMAPWGQPSGNKDAWDGYRPARNRILDFLAEQDMKNAVVLTGDVHSSWAYDLLKDPWSDYDPRSGRGTAAIEIVTPSVTSPSGWGDAAKAAEHLATVLAQRPHLKWADGLSRGYVVLDITVEAVQADWFSVPTVESRTDAESFTNGFRSAFGDPHLVEVSTPARSALSAVEPAL
jgi:alkaline phosphatase D